MTKLLIKQFLFSFFCFLFLTGCESPFGSVEFVDSIPGSNQGANAGLPTSLCTADQEASIIILPSQGSGTANDPYLICNIFQLQLMGNVDFEENASVLAGNENLNAYFELGTNIDASITSTWNGGEGFIPIGALGTDYYGIGTTAGFSGSFDGNNYTINGLSINRDRGTVGMFGVIAPFAVVSNLRITNINVTQNATTNNLTGALAGRLHTHLKNIYIEGSVQGFASSPGPSLRTGGVAGDAYYSTLRNVHTNMSVVGDNSSFSYSAGGMIGRSQSGLIINSSMQGGVAGGRGTGGMIGLLVNNYTTSIAFSSVVADVDGEDETGGLVGNWSGSNGALSHHSSFSGDINGINDVGGLVGRSDAFLFSLADGIGVKNSFARGTIFSSGGNVGGLIGSSLDAGIADSFSNMNITSNAVQTGGIIGEKNSSVVIKNSFASGFINNSAFGISGSDGSNLSNVHWFDGGVDVINCYPSADLNCNDNGAPISQSDFYNPGQGVYVDGATSWDFEHIWQARPNNFPILRLPSEINTGLIGSGTEADPFLIGSILEWNLIGDNPHLMGSFFRLTSDLNFSGLNCTSMIGSRENNFLGVIDGHGFRISNFSCDSDISNNISFFDGIGLIRYASGAEIKNLQLTDFTINVSNLIASGSGFGALVGYCQGCLIKNITISASTINASFVTGGLIGDGTGVQMKNISASLNGVSGIAAVGGLMGIGRRAMIKNSFVRTNVVANNSFGGAGFIGESSVGTDISDSFFIGSVINNSVSGDSYGITNSSSATLTNVYWDDTIPGTEAVTCHSGGDSGCFKETDQTQFYLSSHPVYNRVGFAWDFVNTWREIPGDFPQLR